MTTVQQKIHALTVDARSSLNALHDDLSENGPESQVAQALAAIADQLALANGLAMVDIAAKTGELLP